MAKLSAAVLFAFALLATNCSHGPEASMRGTYANDSGEATLDVTADEIILKSNWVRLGAHYRVESVSGSDVIVELSFANVAQKGKAVIGVRDNSLVFSRRDDGAMFAGTWKRM